MTVTCGSILLAQENKSYITAQKVPASFTLSSSGKTAPIYVSSQDYPGVLRVAKHLQADLKRVTSAEPALITDVAPAAGEVVLVGTIGKNPLIDKLIEQRRLDAAGIAGRWEVFLIQVVEQPLPGVDRALVIAGSDKRGTIYGMYDLSAQIGVSPWYWWADVPAKKQSSLFVLSGRHTQGEPAVKYRGIFINDEAPALTGLAFEKFGGFNHRFYEHVFELILRMKGNFLWPAMWGRAFYDDDPENPRLADEYGVVIGTSHHEPMMRAHDEWRRYGNGPWNYQTNADTLKQFWKEGIRRT
ncbi:MAG TPA: glycosyl hydrolase 115 family protein, partial [Bacteroidota bacterium]